MSHENNQKLAAMFRQIAALLAEQGVDFKPAAYRRAAQLIEDQPTDMCSYKDEKELKKFPGIGDAIAGKIREFCTTGKMKALSELAAEQGGISEELMLIEDLGPKRARQIQTALGITTTAELIKAAEAGLIQKLPRFSETIEKKILENARMVSERSKRYLRTDVVDDVEMLVNTIQKVPGVEKCAVAGSYRREKSTVGDIDVLVVCKNAAKVSEAISKLPIVEKVVAHGDTKLSFNLESKLRVDIRFVKRDQWGAALIYFTGSKEHNIVLRKRAIEKGWKLNEYSLSDKKEKVIASREEEDVYKALGLPWIEPKDRIDSLPPTPDDLPF